MLITIHSTLRASDSPTPDSGTIHYGAHSNGNSNGTRKASRVIIEEAPSNNTWQIADVLCVKNKNKDIIRSKRITVCKREDKRSTCIVCSGNCFSLNKFDASTYIFKWFAMFCRITIHFIYSLSLPWATNTEDLLYG